MIPLSLVITTLNNGATLERCLASAPFADDKLVLDSGSQDDTLAIAAKHGARIATLPFQGYGPQKAHAISLARHDWILLLDADEALSPALADEITALLVSPPPHSGYTLPRQEWLYWRWPHPATRLTRHLRLFHRDHYHMDDHPIHAAPKLDAPVGRLQAPLLHYGEADLETKWNRINAYTSGAVAWRRQRGVRWPAARLLLAPPAAFLREYVWRRQFLNGWAGWIAARSAAAHAFLRYAKLLEAARRPPGGGF